MDNKGWVDLTTTEQLSHILQLSHPESSNGVLIFKHSTRCSISTMAKSRLERSWNFEPEKLPLFYLDLISYREISNSIANQLGVKHESPQILLVKNGKCVYNASHSDVSVENINDFLNY